MSDYWHVVGRFCMDEDFQTELLGNVVSLIKPAELKKMHDFLCGTQNKLLLTPWDVADINFLADRINKDPDGLLAAQALASSWQGPSDDVELFKTVGLFLLDSHVSKRYKVAVDSRDALENLIKELAKRPVLNPRPTGLLKLKDWLKKSVTKDNLQLVHDAGWIYPANTGDESQVLDILRMILKKVPACSSGYSILQADAAAKDGAGNDYIRMPYVHLPAQLLVPLVKHLYDKGIIKIPDGD